MSGAFAASPTGVFIMSPVGSRRMSQAEKPASFICAYVDEVSDAYYDSDIDPMDPLNLQKRDMYELDVADLARNVNRIDMERSVLGVIHVRLDNGGLFSIVPPQLSVPEFVRYVTMPRDPSRAQILSAWTQLLGNTPVPIPVPIPRYNFIDESDSMDRSDIEPGWSAWRGTYPDYFGRMFVVYFPLNEAYTERWLAWLAVGIDELVAIEGR